MRFKGLRKLNSLKKLKIMFKSELRKIGKIG